MLEAPITITNCHPHGFAFAKTDDAKTVFIPQSVAEKVSLEYGRRYLARLVENRMPEKAPYMASFVYKQEMAETLIPQMPQATLESAMFEVLHGGGIWTLSALAKETGKRLGTKLMPADGAAIHDALEAAHTDGKVCELHLFTSSDDDDAAVTAYVASVNAFINAI